MPFKVSTFRTDSADGRNFVLAVEAVCWTDVRRVFERVVLPVGSTSDGGSIPEFLWSIPGFQPFGEFWRWYWLHDGLYRGEAITENAPWTREDADRLLLQGMQATAMPLTLQEAIYRAVRDFGQPAWDRGHP